MQTFIFEAWAFAKSIGHAHMGDVSLASLLPPIVDVPFTLNSHKSGVIYNNVAHAKHLQRQLDGILWRGV